MFDVLFMSFDEVNPRDFLPVSRISRKYMGGGGLKKQATEVLPPLPDLL